MDQEPIRSDPHWQQTNIWEF